MKIHTKLLLISLLPIFLFTGTAGWISYHFAGNALVEHSSQWLEIRLSEAVIVVKKHENILHKYGLQNIPASIAKAKLDALAELASTKIGKNGYIFIADRQGVIVSHPDKYYVGTDAGLTDWFTQLSEKKNKTDIIIKNTNHIAVYDFFIPWEWYIIVVEPEKSIFEPIKNIKTILLFLAAGSIIAVFCFTNFFIKRLIKPLKQITNSARKIKTIEPDTLIPIQSKDEFAELACSFNKMTKHYQDKLNHLQKDHAYYSALLHHTTDLITITDRQGQFVFVSPSSKRITGYAPDELLGKKASEFLFPSQKDQLIEHLRLSTLSEVASPPAEFGFKHKDGHQCTLESISKNLLSHPDVKGVVTTSRNINKRKSEQDALKKSCRQMEKQLDDKTKQVAQLSRHLADLEKNSRAAAASLASFSSKISNDLSPVTGFSQLLPIMIQDKDIQTCLAAINRAGNRILHTTRNMTILSSLSSGTFQVKNKAINVHHLLEDLGQRYKTMIIGKPVLFIMDLDALLPNCLLLDKTCLEQILVNLMDNAIKHTRSGHIKLTSHLSGLSDDDGSCIDLAIRIEGTGNWLTDKSIKMMTSALSQTTKNHFGPDNMTGDTTTQINLFICRHLIDLMEGRFDIEKLEGQGSSFNFYLPKIKTGRTLDDIDQTAGVNIKENSFKGLTCLIGDESSEVMFMLSHALQYSGTQSLTADTGTQLLRRAQEKTPGLIFLSTQLPGMESIDILSMLKQHPLTRNIPVIMMSDQSNDPSADPGKNAASDGFLLKPINIQELFCLVHKHLKTVTDKPLAPKTSLLSIESIKLCCNENDSFKRILSRDIAGCFPESTQGINMIRINEFAQKIIKTGEDFKLTELTDFGKKLSKYARDFDIEKLETSLDNLFYILNTIDLD